MPFINNSFVIGSTKDTIDVEPSSSLITATKMASSQAVDCAL